MLLDDHFLPIQLVYQGKTFKCHPFQFLSNWHITHSHNHWCNEDTVKDYITKILVPYVSKKWQELKLKPDHHALVIYDKFKAQCTRDIIQLLEEHTIWPEIYARTILCEFLLLK